MEGRIVFTPKLLTETKEVVADNKVVSIGELLFQEMDVRIGKGYGRRSQHVYSVELREEIRTL